MSVWINNRPLTALVAGIIGLDGYLAPDAASSEIVPMGDRAPIFGTSVIVTPRTITVVVDLAPMLLTERAPLLDALALLLRGRLTLRASDRPTREIDVVCQGPPTLDFYGPPLALAACTLTVTFVAADPVWRDVEPLVYGIGTVGTVMPLGTATSAPTVTIYGGSVVDPAVIVRSANGEEVSRLSLRGTLATNDALVIDAAAQTIDRYVAGVRQTGAAAGLAWLSSGAFPVLDPADGDAPAAQWPTVELSSLSGSPTGLVTYVRRYA